MEENDSILRDLKAAYFSLCYQEIKAPNKKKKKIAKELDKLEKEIFNRQKELQNV